MKRTCAVLALLLVALGASGAEVVSWIGTRERVIDGYWIDIPLDLAAPVDAKAPSVIQVTASGREVNATAVKAELTTANNQSYLHLWPDPAQFARNGAYLVKIRIPKTGDYAASLIELTLTRPSGDLSLATPMRTERVIYVPGLDCWYPKRWPLAASGVDITPSAGERVITFLGPDQKGIGAKLKLKLPAKIVAAKQSDVTLDQTATFPLGTSTGKLTIEAPQLAKPFETAIDVVSRVSRWWLLLTIALSILLGHAVRRRWEEKRLRGIARAAFDKYVEVVRGVVSTTVDADFRKRLETALTELEAAADRKAAAIEDAMTAAKSAVGAIQVEMAEAQKQAETELRGLRAATGNPGAHFASLRTTLAGLAARVDEAQTNLAAGQIGLAKKSAGEIASALPAEVETARLGWQQFVSDLVALAGAWPESPKNDLLQKAAAAAEEAARVDSLEQAKAFVESAAGVTGDLREALFGVVSGARKLSARAVKELDPFRKQSEVATALDALTALGETPVATAAEPLAQQAFELREAMTKALTSVVPQGQNPPDSLTEGKFAQALADVLALRSQQPLGDTARAEPFLVSSRFAESTAATPAAPADALPVGLIVENEAVAGRYVRVRLYADDPSIAAASMVVTWYRDDRRLHTAPAGELALDFIADAAPLVIRAEVSAAGRTGMASTRVVPYQPFVTDPAAWTASSAWEQWKQTLVAGAFIVVIGYLIFADGFIGTLGQFLGAALWGFVIDVTLPTVISYAAPVAGKSPALT